LNQSLKDFSKARTLQISDKITSQYDPQSQKILRIIADKQDMKRPVNNLVVKGIIQQLPAHDIIIMIPHGCFSFMTSFLSDKTASKIMLWEIHNEPSKLGDTIWINQSIKGKKCLIIDKAYTGRTIQMMAQRVKKWEEFQ